MNSSFIHDDFMLTNDYARELYHESAEKMPIIDYHCHLVTKMIAENYQFNDGSVPGKMQLGSGWWFLDQEDGMKKQMNALSALGLLCRFVGMLTDSRSFLSYPRHEYFRRILCNLIGEDIQSGKLPKSEMALLHKMVKDISYNNAESYFNF